MSEHIAFVAGATGFVGREVVRSLRDADVRVIAHVRPDSSRLAEWQDRFSELGSEVDTTAWEVEAMSARMKELQPTAVFALLGTTRKRSREEGIDNPYERIDYGLTSLLIKAAVAGGSQPRFVYLSSAGIGENPRTAYMKSRYKTEKELTASGLPYTIARPSFIIGSGRDDKRPMERVAAVASDSALRIASLFGGRKLRSRYRSTSNTLLAATLARFIFESATSNRVLEGDDLR